ncbi:MAG: 50S ribosomal protein L25 [Actinobacteria bacterium]|nr:50S ribosomal protein L25 [Actinomycetota bacterium]
MSKVVIESVARTDFGKGAARKIRRDGWIPAVVYGGSAPEAHISVPGHDLMMALKRAGVVLEVQIDGATVNTAPRQVQKDPVKGFLEHVDLIVLTDKEVRERLVVGAAVAKAEKAAVEADLDKVTVVMAVRELLDEGVEVDAAIAGAIEAVQEEQAAAAAAAIVAAAAEDAAAAVAAESGEGDAAEAGADAGSSDKE